MLTMSGLEIKNKWTLISNNLIYDNNKKVNGHFWFNY